MWSGCEITAKPSSTGFLWSCFQQLQCLKQSALSGSTVTLTTFKSLLVMTFFLKNVHLTIFHINKWLWTFSLQCQSGLVQLSLSVLFFSLTKGDLLQFLKKRKPKDAFCIVGITMIDLYPKDSWNFVFGQASLTQGEVSKSKALGYSNTNQSWCNLFHEHWGGDA